VLVLAPLLLMTALGIRGISVSRRDTLETARAEAGRAADYAARQFEEKLPGLRAQARPLRLYPLVPQPTEGSDAANLYAQATGAPPSDAEKIFLTILTEHPDALNSTGLPCAPLIAWSRLKTCEDPAQFGLRLEALARFAVDTHPSILTPELLSRAEDLAGQRGAETACLVQWRQRWDEDEIIRGLIDHDTAAPNDPSARWMTHDQMRWWVESSSGHWSVLNAGTLISAAKVIIADKQALLPESARLSIRWAGYSLVSADGEPLAERGSGPLSVIAALANPAALYQQQRRQTLWLAALLGLGLLTALGGFYLMQRALTSERHLNEKKSDFVASVSHELRAPVASMRLMLENLDSGAVKTEESRREYLRLLGGECRRLSALIENVLDFARIEHERKIYQLAEADIPALIQDAIQLLQPRATQRRQTIHAEVLPIEPIPQIDALAVQQALINLIDNAIKFSPENTAIAVKVGPRDGQTWQLSVADQGPGIPKHEHARIFERFYRIGSELRRETQGSGIGLSIVKHTVDAHGGGIEIDSSPGTGAKFILIFPFSTARQA
jgi:signal transduction histidine kinase